MTDRPAPRRSEKRLVSDQGVSQGHPAGPVGRLEVDDQLPPGVGIHEVRGLHDLQRVADLTRHFGIETLVCVNKCDLNEGIASEIEDQARRRGLTLAGKVRYDRAVTEAQLRKKSLVEYQQNGAAEDIKALWARVHGTLTAEKGHGADG